MTFPVWLIFGILIGAVFTLLLKNRDAGLYIATMALGLMGSIFGAFIGTLFGIGRTTAFEWISLVPAAAGALLLLGIYMFARKVR